MQKINIIHVGDIKDKEDYYKKAVDEYEKRLSAAFKIINTEIKEERLSDKPSAGEILAGLKKEAAKIAEKSIKGAYKIALCVEGKKITSEDFSALIYGAKIKSSPSSAVEFIIGSSHGLADEIKKSANLMLSFSDMTFPHRLMRVMLIEQIYRAYTIQSGIRYHK